MPSVADKLRRETIREVLRLSPAERVALALELGDFDLALFCAKQNVQPSDAIEQLHRMRQSGRRTNVSTGDSQ